MNDQTKITTKIQDDQERHARVPKEPALYADNHYWFECFQDGKIYVRRHGVLESAVFYGADDLDEKVDVIASKSISDKVRIPFLINMKGVGMYSSKLYVAYDVFDSNFLPWYHANLSKATSPDWWIEQITNVLDVLYTMKGVRVCHGNLKSPKSYVIVGDNINIINAGKSTEELTIDEREAHEKKDLRDFRAFLKSYAHHCDVIPDWAFFKATASDCTVEQLRKHPMLLTGIERLTYFREIIQHVKRDMGDRDKANLKRHTDHLFHHEFSSWGLELQSHPKCLIHRAFTVDRKVQPCWETLSPYDILHCVEVVLDHANTYIPTMRIVGVETQISHTFPSFLAGLHYNLVRHFPKAKITKYKLT